MIRSAVAGAITLCGIGLCMIGGASLLERATPAHAASGSTSSALTALAGMANAQAGPTVVWYGVGSDTSRAGCCDSSMIDRVYRAWSDGTVEMKRVYFAPNSPNDCGGSTVNCAGPWIVISSPTAGFKAAADINADESVDGADLTSVLSSWGAAPRVPFPPSNCPLDLINP